MHVPLSVRQCLTVSAAPGCRGDLHTFCCFHLSRNVAYSLFPCTPPWASYTARNEHSCHSRQSSVFPLSECAINLRILLVNPKVPKMVLPICCRCRPMSMENSAQ